MRLVENVSISRERGLNDEKGRAAGEDIKFLHTKFCAEVKHHQFLESMRHRIIPIWMRKPVRLPGQTGFLGSRGETSGPEMPSKA